MIFSFSMYFFLNNKNISMSYDHILLHSHVRVFWGWIGGDIIGDEYRGMRTRVQRCVCVWEYGGGEMDIICSI